MKTALSLILQISSALSFCLVAATFVAASPSQAAPPVIKVSKEVQPLNQATFQAFINQPQGVVIDVYADWCGPCKMMKPHFERAANDLGAKYAFGKVDASVESALCTILNVRALPTLLFYKEGNLVSRSVGYKSFEELVTTIERELNPTPAK